MFMSLSPGATKNASAINTPPGQDYWARGIVGAAGRWPPGFRCWKGNNFWALWIVICNKLHMMDSDLRFKADG